MEDNKSIFIQGYRDGIPIGLGYFAVAVSLGIAARDYGFTAGQGFLASLLTYASAGQYMGFALYATNAGLIELIILTFIINARYLLMGAALNQRMPEGTPLYKRLLIGTCITDEVFGITIARPGIPNPFYSLGAIAAAVPMWAAGTAVGISLGNILPERIVSALGVALFGMFLAVIIPPARKDRAVGLAIAVSFAGSYAASRLPGISSLSQGNRTILLTLVICTAFALIAPRQDLPETEEAGQGANEGGGDGDAH